MQVASLDKEVSFSPEKPVIKAVLETRTSKEVRIALAKGQEMKEHKAPFPIVVELFRGKLDFSVGEETLEMEEGGLVALEADVPHALLAREDSVVRLTLHKKDSLVRVQGVPLGVNPR